MFFVVSAVWDKLRPSRIDKLLDLHISDAMASLACLWRSCGKEDNFEVSEELYSDSP